MGWLSRLLRRAARNVWPQSRIDVPLPLLVHTHVKEALPPGPVEEGIVEWEQDDVIVHTVAGVLQPDGSIHDLPEEKFDWARRLTYCHLKREGCLADFGVPIIPAYEYKTCP